MKNRAKCRLCGSIIESYFDGDYVECKCGEIAVSGGLGMHCHWRNAENLIRVDDDGNNIIPQYVDEVPEDAHDKKDHEHQKEIARDECIYILDQLIEHDSALPTNIQTSPALLCDLIKYALVISRALKL